MKNELSYVAYHGSNGYALLVLSQSVGATRALVAKKGKTIDLLKLKASDFDKQYLKVDLGRRGMNNLAPASLAAEKLLKTGLPFSKDAIDHIERTLGMDTRGKSTMEIRKEIARLANDLPKGHAMRNVPETYPDRGQAIAAYTAMRQEIFNHSKENDMSKKEAAAGTEAKKEAKKPSKATVTKKDAPAATEKPTKAAKPAKKERAPREQVTGPYKATTEAAKAKTPEELRMHEGSARYQIMAHVLGKKGKSVTFDEIKGIAGDLAAGAIKVLVKVGHLELAK